MKPIDQTTSFELSKRLEELGVKQESLFWWYIPKAEIKSMIELVYGKQGHDTEISTGWNCYSAFTVAEILKIYRENFGKNMYIRQNIAPEYFTDYLAETLIQNLLPDII